MSANLQDTLILKFAVTYKRLNATGKNLGGRIPVVRELSAVAPAGNNPLKDEPGGLQLQTADALIVMDLELREFRPWSDAAGQIRPGGDARLEVARLLPDLVTPVTREQLLGSALSAGQVLRYRLDGDPDTPGSGGELFTPVDGSIEDRDGLTWRLLLKKVV